MGPAARICLAALALLAAGTPGPAQQDPWAFLQRPGHAVFMRHSGTAGGAGDPPGFALADCATQRNLTDTGRAQAQRTGEVLKAKGIAFDRVLTSPWCRCRDTARLVAGADGEVMPALSNLVGRHERAADQMAVLRRYLADLAADTRMLFVTHGVVIAALTGLNPAEGEMVIVSVGAAGDIAIAGRLKVE